MCDFFETHVRGVFFYQWKIARKYYYETLKSKTKNQIISFDGSFHGRTLGSLAAGGPSKLEPFNTEVSGFRFLDFGNLEKVKEIICEDGEGGKNNTLN